MNLRNFGLDTATFSGSLEVKLKACAAAGFSQIMLWARDLADHSDGFDAAVKVVRDSGLEVSGLQATIASWQGAVSVRLWHYRATHPDMAEVSLIPSHGAGDTIPLYAGPVSGVKLRAIGADGRCDSCKASFPPCRRVRVEG